MDRVDALVIGAGVIGLATGRALALRGREVIVLEKERTVGTGVSSRNSEVIHAGLYYPTGSLKAQLCVAGREQLYAFCEKRGVGVWRCGKLVVATRNEELEALTSLAARARANGAPVEELSAEQARRLEPELRCVAALLSPTTGIVDSHGLMRALRGDLEQAGGTVALGSRVSEVEPTPGGLRVCIVDSATGVLQGEVLASAVVNATGLHAIPLARRIVGLSPKYLPRPHYAKGTYFTLSSPSPFSRLIYPLPPPGSLGIHLTLDLGRRARFGPDLEWLSEEDPDRLDYTVDLARAEPCYEEVRRYWPGLPDGALQPGYSGVRPKIHGPGEALPDFRVDGPEEHGISGLINLFGIESPGLTASLALGELVAKRLA
ncbi:MAG: NAD(P)/FAD-dependent oxidoreductase [Myxococcales bacterium]|nr:NAD(P)/FAD-dependent oxidoreductase [Polyangiaceae bacterium]MDW8250955.1 NAD(P)/FAD-dependent oxidoreductase [Myxococcales bacterium]